MVKRKSAPIVNPYIAGNPVIAPEMFFGRQDVFTFVRENLVGQYQDHAIVLHGQRRTGKTSILYQMDRHLDPIYVPILVDLQGMTLKGLGDFLWELASRISQELNLLKGLEVNVPTLESFLAKPRVAFGDEFLPKVRKSLSNDNILLLMLDEIERLDDEVHQGRLHRGIFNILGSLMQHTPGLGFVFTVSRRLDELRLEYTSLFRTALYKKVSFLDLEDGERLIVEPVRNIYRYEPDAVDRILQITSAHPYYTQLICHSLFNMWRRSRPDAIAIEAVEGILPEVVERGSVNLTALWGDTTDDNKVMLTVLAEVATKRGLPVTQEEIVRTLDEQRINLPIHEVERNLDDIAANDYVTPTPPYSFKVDLLRLWLIQERKLAWVQRHLAEGKLGTIRRPRGITCVVLLDILAVLVHLLTFVLIARANLWEFPPVAYFPYVAPLIIILTLIEIWGLWFMKDWGWILAVASKSLDFIWNLASLNLLQAQPGIILGLLLKGVIIVYLTRPRVRAAFPHLSPSVRESRATKLFYSVYERFSRIPSSHLISVLVLVGLAIFAVRAYMHEQEEERLDLKLWGDLGPSWRLEADFEDVTPPPWPDWPLVLEDDFSDKHSGWGQMEDRDSGEARYENGRYSITVTSDTMLSQTFPVILSDFALEVEAQSVKGGGWYGVVFRYQDPNNFYFFGVNGSRLRLLKVIRGQIISLTGVSVDLGHFTLYASRDNQPTNHFKVLCRGHDFSLYLNEHYIATVSDDPYKFFNKGKVGISVGDYKSDISIHQVYFDDFRVYAPDAKIAPTMTPPLAEIEATDADDYLSRAYTYLEMGDYDKVIADCDQAIALEPEEADHYHLRGLAYMGMDDLELALSDLNKAVALEPEEAEHYSARGLVYLKTGDPNLALSDFDKAIEFDPYNAEYYAGRAALYIELGDFKQALADSDKAIEIDANSLLGYFQRCAAHLHLGNYESALADCNTAVDLDPSRDETYFSRGTVYIYLEDFESALADFNMAIDLNPSRGETYYLRAWVHVSFGDTEQAVQDFEKHLQLMPNSPFREEAEQYLKNQ